MNKILVASLCVCLLAVTILWYQNDPDRNGTGKRLISKTSSAPAQQPASQDGADEDAQPSMGEDITNVITGKSQFEALDRAKGTVAQADLSVYRTAITMFYTQNNRFPKDLNELFESRFISQDAVVDAWGQPFRSEVKDDDLILYSSGKDKVAHTSDDLWQRIPMK